MKRLIRAFTKKDNLEYEFLPAALEVVETPHSPLSRAIVWVVFVMLVITILWAYLGKVDMVAVARGKVVPDGRIKVIQPFEEGIIQAIYVNEGQRVKQGDILVELDATMNQIDINNLQHEISTIKLERDLLNTAMHDGNIEEITHKDNLPEELKDNLIKLTEANNDAYQLKKKAAELAVSQFEEQLKIEQSTLDKIKGDLLLLNNKKVQYEKLAALGGVETANLKKLDATLAILNKDEALYKMLYENEAIAKVEWEEKHNTLSLTKKEYEAQKVKSEEEKISLALNLNTVLQEIEVNKAQTEIQAIKIEQTKGDLEEAKINLENLTTQKNISGLDLVLEKDKKVLELEAQLTKAQKNMEFKSIVSPVDGTIHGMGMNTIGGVVTPAEPIMTIVPEGTPLIIEAKLLNKDIGFVEVGQEVTIKVDTFPFQKYGTVKGIIKNISPDAVDDEKIGSVYKMMISIEQTALIVDGKQVSITPGMTVTAEIKTGKRKIISFFLEPLVKYIDESIKLR